VVYKTYESICQTTCIRSGLRRRHLQVSDRDAAPADNRRESEGVMKKTKIWEVVKDLERSKSKAEIEIGEIRATLVVNYGEEGRHIKGLIYSSESTISMLVKVLTYFSERKRDND